MHRYFSIYRSNPFYRHNIVFFFGSVSVGALNYLYYPIIGRLLTPGAFGEVQTLISLFLQLTIFLNVLSLVAVNLIAHQKSERTQKVVTELQLAALWVTAVVFLITALTATFWRDLLRFESGWPFVLLTLALMAAVPFTFQTAYLRGAKRFGVTSTANLLVAGGKILLSVLLVLAGLGTGGAIGGLIAAQVVGLIYAASKTGLSLKSASQILRARPWPDLRIIRSELSYIGYTLIGSLAVMLLLSLDVVLVKYFFDAHTAGLYAAVATVARVIFFLTASVAQVLLPSVKPGNLAADNNGLLLRSLGIVTLLSAPVLAVCALWPGQTLEILMGGQYVALSNLLPLLALAIFLVSILNVIVSFFLALRRYTPIMLVAGGAFLTLASMLLKHNSLQDIVMILFTGSAAIVGVVAVWFLVQKRGVLKYG